METVGAAMIQFLPVNASGKLEPCGKGPLRHRYVSASHVDLPRDKPRDGWPLAPANREIQLEISASGTNHEFFHLTKGTELEHLGCVESEGQSTGSAAARIEPP
jgi:hypothetical protein